MQLALIQDYQFPETAPLRYFGGKWSLAKWIVPILWKYFPDHRYYIEPFGGGFGIGFQKRQVECQVYNEINPDPLFFFKTLQTNYGELIAAISNLNWNEEEYSKPPTGKSEIDEAARIYLKARTGFVGAGGRWECGVSKDRINDRNHYCLQSLLSASLMLQSVQISSKPALKCIKEWNHSDALIYLDPPYLHSARGSKDSRSVNPVSAIPRRQYKFEMSEAEHIELIKHVQSMCSGVMLSGYDSPLYDSLCDGWDKVSNPDPASKECLWIKRPKYYTQLSFVS